MAPKKADLKRKAKSVKISNAKQLKVDRVEGWLEGEVAEVRRGAQDVKFNEKRLRFLSDTKTVIRGTEGVVYWMGRDQRVQGNFKLAFANIATKTF